MARIPYELIYLQSESARMGLKELSQQVKKSPQNLNYNLAMLQKDKVLKDPFCIFDYSYFGLLLFRVYFRGGYISELDKENIVRELSENPYVVSIYELSGEFDLTVEFAAPNPSKFNKELKNISMTIPSLNDYKIILNLVSHICPRNYLVMNENLHKLNKDRVVGGDRDTGNFNKNELNVMKNILLNPVVRLTELSKKCDLNVKTVNSILKNLNKRNILKGFRYNVDTNKLNVNKVRLFLRLHNVTKEREAALMGHILETHEVVQVNKTVGDWDMEIDLESLNKMHTRYFLMSLREEFKDVIESFNMIEFYDYYKRSYLPMYMFGNEKKD